MLEKAMIDVNPDEAIEMSKKKKLLRWDAKKGKFIKVRLFLFLFFVVVLAHSHDILAANSLRNGRGEEVWTEANAFREWCDDENVLEATGRALRRMEEEAQDGNQFQRRRGRHRLPKHAADARERSPEGRAPQSSGDQEDRGQAREPQDEEHGEGQAAEGRGESAEEEEFPGRQERQRRHEVPAIKTFFSSVSPSLDLFLSIPFLC